MVGKAFRLSLDPSYLELEEPSSTWTRDRFPPVGWRPQASLFHDFPPVSKQLRLSRPSVQP